jgi:hypothetical protein
MSLRRAPETSLPSLIVLLAAAMAADACGPVGKAVRAGDGEAPPPEGGSGGDSSETGGSRGGTGGRGTGGSPGGDGGSGNAGGSTGGTAGADASPPPDVAPPPDTRGTGGMDASPPRDTSPPDLPPPPDTAPASTLNDGLVSRWKLDEGSGTTARDAVTASGNDGTLSGGTTWTKTGFPGAKYTNAGALTFDGTDGIANLGVKGIPAIDQAMTIALWVNYSAAPAMTQPFIGFGASGTGRLKVGFNGGQLAAWKGAGSTPLVSAAPPASGWHHLAYTFDGTTRRLYIDGSEKNSSTMAGETGAVAEAHIGSYGTQHFAGTLDEVRVYKRALTASEVMQLAGGNE